MDLIRESRHLGSKGCVRTENKGAYVYAALYSRFGRKRKATVLFPQRYERTYGEEISRFAEAIADDTETPVTGIDGLRPMLIGLAVKRGTFKPAPGKGK